jgi:hypothetical protein
MTFTLAALVGIPVCTVSYLLQCVRQHFRTMALSNPLWWLWRHLHVHGQRIAHGWQEVSAVLDQCGIGTVGYSYCGLPSAI